MKIETAVRVRDLSLRAIESLTEALDVGLSDATGEEVERLRRAAGISIGTIDVQFLRVSVRPVSRTRPFGWRPRGPEVTLVIGQTPSW